jgi:hypothetical protein
VHKSQEMRSILTIMLLTVIAGPAARSQPISFTDIGPASGVNVANISTPESRYIIESMSGGAAVFDCDGDGFLDIATVNGSSVERYKRGGDPVISLYRQVDGGTSKTPKFENITPGSGLTWKGWGMGVSVVDFDNDGIHDLFVTGFSGNVMYRGTGDCKYTDVTEKAKLRGSGFMAGSGWADFDRDGDLDVYVTGYVFLDLKNLPVFGSSPECTYRGIRVQCGPRGLRGEPDFFFRNEGDGTFTDVTAAVGMEDKKKYYGLGAVWNDYDNDGWPDLYVANDATPNFLYKNRSGTSFEETGFQTGTAYNLDGIEQGSMGIAWGDFDNDGLFDVFVTNFASEHNTLYRNLGARGFIDVSMESKIGAISKPYVGWGTGFVDFDNDGWQDILVANGHVYPQMELAQSPGYLGFRQHFLLHRNLGNGKFDEIAAAAGLQKVTLRSQRGVAFGDLNNDGLVDAVVTSVGDLPSVLLNTTQNKNRSVSIRLLQPEKNRYAIGSRVTVKTRNRSQMREVESGSSYLSQNDLSLHFGLGLDEKIDSIEVRWSDGSTEKVAGVEPGKIFTIQKGKGVVEAKNYRRP